MGAARDRTAPGPRVGMGSAEGMGPRVRMGSAEGKDSAASWSLQGSCGRRERRALQLLWAKRSSMARSSEVRDETPELTAFSRIRSTSPRLSSWS